MKIVVAIVNYNGEEFISDAVQSALAQVLPREHSVTVCVVDNASTDQSLIRLKPFGDRIKLIASRTNDGFAGGNNRIFEAFPDADAFALLNPDATAANDWLKHSLIEAETHPQWGMVQPKIMQFYDKTKVDNVGHRMFMDGTVRGRGRNETDHYDESREIMIASGCAVLLKAEAIRKIGGFDESFFCYCDDVELSLRIQLLGYTGYFCPHAIVHHRFSAVEGEAFSPFKAYHVERNRNWVVMKCFPALLIAPAMLAMAMRYGAGFISTYLRKKGPAAQLVKARGSSSLFGTLYKAHKDAWKQMPSVLRKRRQVQKTSQLSTREFIRRWRRDYLSLREVVSLE